MIFRGFGLIVGCVFAAGVITLLANSSQESEKARIQRLLERAAAGQCDRDLSSDDLQTCINFQIANQKASD
jgi:hypothetical protein